MTIRTGGAPNAPPDKNTNIPFPLTNVPPSPIITNQLVIIGEGALFMHQRNSEETKRNILSAAEIEFAEKGLSGARVDEIAARAKVNKALLYQYFGNKEELYKSVLEMVYGRLTELEEHIIRRSEGCMEEIRAFVRAYFHFLRENPSYVRMVMWENLNYGKFFREKGLSGVKDIMKSGLHHILERGKERGEVAPEIRSEDILQTLIACSFNYFSNRYTLEQVFDRDAVSEENMERRITSVSDMLIRYLGHGCPR